MSCEVVCVRSGESALGAVEEAAAEAAKHGDRSEPLAALVAEAREMLEQAKTEQAERTKAAAEEAAAAASGAAERLHMQEEAAALTLRLQQIQAQLGSRLVPPAAPAPHRDAVLVFPPTIVWI